MADRWKAMAAAAVLTLAAGACGGGSSSDSKPELTGTFTLTAAAKIGRPQGVGGPCYGTGGYDDIETGLQVVVTDGDGKTLATGHLGVSKYVQDPKYPILGSCVFPIEVDTPLPKADFYKVEVGRRGDLTYSYDELKDKGWSVDFTLG